MRRFRSPVGWTAVFNVLLAAVVAHALSGCGGDKGDASTFTGPPLVIGISLSLTGDFAGGFERLLDCRQSTPGWMRSISVGTTGGSTDPD